MSGIFLGFPMCLTQFLSRSILPNGSPYFTSDLFSYAFHVYIIYSLKATICNYN